MARIEGTHKETEIRENQRQKDVNTSGDAVQGIPRYANLVKYTLVLISTHS